MFTCHVEWDMPAQYAQPVRSTVKKENRPVNCQSLGEVICEKINYHDTGQWQDKIQHRNHTQKYRTSPSSTVCNRSRHSLVLFFLLRTLAALPLLLLLFSNSAFFWAMYNCCSKDMACSAFAIWSRTEERICLSTNSAVSIWIWVSFANCVPPATKQTENELILKSDCRENTAAKKINIIFVTFSSMYLSSKQSIKLFTLFSVCHDFLYRSGSKEVKPLQVL